MAIEVTQCLLSRLFQFFHKLDEIGVYDQSLIFVLADHGEKLVPIDFSAASPGLPEAEASHTAVDSPEGAHIDRYSLGVPVFLAKPLGDRQPLRVSDHPVSVCDVPKSVFDVLAIENDFECESVFSQRSPRQVPRIHYRYPNQKEQRALGIGRGSGFTFERFAVVGHSWLPESWVSVDTDAE
jgi:arylsulfatase A-like enzyme